MGLILLKSVIWANVCRKTKTLLEETLLEENFLLSFNYKAARNALFDQSGSCTVLRSAISGEGFTLFRFQINC